MTGAQTLAAFRRALIPALVVGLGILAIVAAALLSRPEAYSARLGLVASPKITQGGGANQVAPPDYGAVVSLTMQALPELAVSDGTIAAVRAAVPGAPEAAELRAAITVELVPGSSVARVSVVGEDRASAVAMLKALVGQIQQANLLAPVAELKPIGSADGTTQLVSRDPKLALGLGMVAGLVGSLLTVVLVQALRPVLLTAPDAERVVEEVFEHTEPPPVVDVREDVQGTRLLAAHLLGQNPIVTEVNVVPAGPPLRTDLAPRLRNALRDLRVARDVGLLPADPFTGERSDVFGSTPGAPSGNGTPAAQQAPVGGPARAEGAARRPGLFAPIGPPGAAGSSGGEGAAPLSHLVLSVRLGKTTPTALTTALVAMRTHGTGVAGVAVG
jgi:hypothetical protein